MYVSAQCKACKIVACSVTYPLPLHFQYFLNPLLKFNIMYTIILCGYDWLLYLWTEAVKHLVSCGLWPIFHYTNCVSGSSTMSTGIQIIHEELYRLQPGFPFSTVWQHYLVHQLFKSCWQKDKTDHFTCSDVTVQYNSYQKHTSELNECLCRPYKPVSPYTYTLTCFVSAFIFTEWIIQ